MTAKTKVKPKTKVTPNKAQLRTIANAQAKKAAPKTPVESVPKHHRSAVKKSVVKKLENSEKKAAAKQAAVTSLKQFAESHSDGIQKATYFKVDPDLVTFEKGFNLREEGAALDEHLEKMYHAMKNGATFPPIDVKVIDGKIVARDGHCRTRVAKRLKKEGQPIMLEARQLRGNDADDVLHMLGSDQGKSFTPLEQGRGFLRLIKFGMTNAQIAEKTGLHTTTIANGLLLAEAPAAVQKFVTNGQISINVALKVLKKHSGQAATDRLQAMIDAANGKKVTPKMTEDTRVKPAVAKVLYEGMQTIRSCMTPELYSDLMTYEMAELVEKTVAVPATVLRQMIDACTPPVPQAVVTTTDEDLDDEL